MADTELISHINIPPRTLTQIVFSMIPQQAVLMSSLICQLSSYTLAHINTI